MLANLLSLNISSAYLHEPDSELMKYRYGNDQLFTQQAFWNFVNSESQKAFKIHMLVCIILLAIYKANASTRMICIKPITLLDVMPEVSDALKIAKVIYICRHPAGRSESILRQLKHDQNIEVISNNELETLGRDWGMTNRKVKDWFQHHPAWHWVFFENLANDPTVEFGKLYEQFGLTWNEWVVAKIQQRTTIEGSGFYEAQRDSRKQPDKWRKSLTEEQVEAIRRGCLPFETNLYDSF